MGGEDERRSDREEQSEAEIRRRNKKVETKVLMIMNRSIDEKVNAHKD